MSGIEALAMRAVYDKAHEAGQRAALAAVPQPMVVVGGDQRWFVPEGVCGFAWVNIKPGTGKFARWLKAEGLARADSYYGGVTIWVSDYNQSHTRKAAYASAFASVLRDAGVTAYAGDRLD